MIKSFLRYLFPPRRQVEYLPLLPLNLWSDRGGPDVPEDLQLKVDMLKAFAVVRNDKQALHMLARNPGVSVTKLIKQYKRQRRREPRLQRAWRRFLRLFEQ